MHVCTHMRMTWLLRNAVKRNEHHPKACYMCTRSVEPNGEPSTGQCAPLCETCAALNVAKWEDMEDLTGTVCVVTGAINQ